jgi:homoaconitase/3-isopropylmalate dehydratase large subunit
MLASDEKRGMIHSLTNDKYTIMHTEFFRERAEPGMLVIGSDSHTCSGGAASALAIGLGAPDVTMALVIIVVRAQRW